MTSTSTEQTPPPPVPDDIAQLSFERALEELGKIVRQLESGDGTLDESIGAYERGALLKHHCESKLQQAQARVDRISLSADGVPKASPANLD